MGFLTASGFILMVSWISQSFIGKPNDYVPVVSAQFLKERLDAITVG